MADAVVVDASVVAPKENEDAIFWKLYSQIILGFSHDKEEGEREVININEERKENFANHVMILAKVQQLAKVIEHTSLDCVEGSHDCLLTFSKVIGPTY